MIGREQLEKIFADSGIELNGGARTDIQVLDERVFHRVLRGGSLAMGESFMDGWWDVDDLAGLVHRLWCSGRYRNLVRSASAWRRFRYRFVNPQRHARAFDIGTHHYDLGNNLYAAMLDSQMTYSCAEWSTDDSLDSAQERKLMQICEALDVHPGDRILDVGCGWGSFMKFAAERYGASCVGLTVSTEQATLGRERCAELPVEFVLSDYRDYQTAERFDHVVSIEMIEAVGPKNLSTFFATFSNLLKPSGRCFIQTSGSLETEPVPNAWLDTYIFPNGVLPSLPQLEFGWRSHFVLASLENIGLHYDRTLMEWWHRFDDAYPDLAARNSKYDERFYRMWKFYLQSCAGFFRAGQGQVWQIVLVPYNTETCVISPSAN